MTITPKVVVLIPPPVLPGDAPINIRMTIVKRLVSDILPMSVVLYPVVVDAEIDWNEEIINLSPIVTSERQFSETKIITVPKNIKTIDIKTTIFV